MELRWLKYGDGNGNRYGCYANQVFVAGIIKHQHHDSNLGERYRLSLYFDQNNDNGNIMEIESCNIEEAKEIVQDYIMKRLDILESYLSSSDAKKDVLYGLGGSICFSGSVSNKKWSQMERAEE